MPEFYTTVRQYTVSTLPVDHPLRRHFEIQITARPGHRWAVGTGHNDSRFTAQYVGVDGNWSRDPGDEEDSAAWTAAHWHDRDTAQRLAEAAAANLEVNGSTAEEAVRQGFTR